MYGRIHHHGSPQRAQQTDSQAQHSRLTALNHGDKWFPPASLLHPSPHAALAVDFVEVACQTQDDKECP